MIRDCHSSTLAEAARFARDEDPGQDDRPTWAELRDETYSAADLAPFDGRCEGCGEPFAADGSDGFCVGHGGAWHPACRDAIGLERAA
jgi:hypothetical protein